MSGATASTEVTALRLKLYGNGYPPLPIIPHDAIDKSSGKRPRLDNWSTIDITPDVIRSWETGPTFQDVGTGIRCGAAIGVDMDIPDEALAAKAREIIRVMLPDTPLIRVGRPPKALFVFQAAEPITKMLTPELILPSGVKTQVEILATGQQFVAAGRHPDTKLPYAWTGRSTPFETPLADLPKVNAAQLKATRDALEALLRSAGGRTKAEIKAAEEGEAPPSNEKPNRKASTFSPPTREEVVSALAAVPNTHDWHGWHRVGAAIWDALGDDGQDLFVAWSAQSPDDTPAYTLKKWRSFRTSPPTVTAATLFYEARQRGWRPKSDQGWWVPPPPPPPPNSGDAPEGDETPPSDDGGPEISLDDFYAYMPLHNYIYTPTRSHWPGTSVNARLPAVSLTHADGTPVLDEKGKPKVMLPATWLDKHKPVEQMTWAPGLPLLIRDKLILEGGWIAHRGATVFNLYRAPEPETDGDPAKAEQWVDHVRHIYPDEADHLFMWLAHRVQRPQDKVNHAIVLGGSQGIGKDTLLEPVKYAIGQWNFQEASPQQILGRFNSFLKSVILRVSEARDLGDFDRFSFYDHMKSYTAAPPDTLRIDEKHLREYNIPNCCGVIITTNHKNDGIYLSADDRRHFVAWSSCQKEDARFQGGYWRDLWNYYQAGGLIHVTAYLRQLDISGFDPKAPPPKTPAFWAIVNSNRAGEEAELADAIDKLGNPDALTLLQLRNITSDSELAAWLEDRKNRRSIPYRLEQCGYIPVRNPTAQGDGLWKIEGKRQAVYARATLTPASQIRAAQTCFGQ